MAQPEAQLPPLTEKIKTHAAPLSANNFRMPQSTDSSSSGFNSSTSDKKYSQSESMTAPPTSAPSPQDSTKKDVNPPHPNVRATTYTTPEGATTSKSNISTPICKNCKTSTTPLWRRDESGQVLCNACGLFLKLHGRPRPISLKTDVIKSRNRVKHPTNQPIQGSSSRSGPNTPELKAKENAKRKNGVPGAPGSQKTDKKRGASPGSQLSPPLVPLLPNGGGPSQSSSNSGDISQVPKSPYMFSHLHHLPPHLQQQVPLHHPASVPTQFASNLQTITSPLLLSTTPKTQVSHHQLAQTQAAAGVLENLSQDRREPEVILPRPHLQPVSVDEKIAPFSPATALSGNHKLPSLLNPVSSFSYSSPSFGPQHSLTNPSAFSLGNATNPPSTSNSTNNTTASQTAPSSADKEEDVVTALKTRISELELVNDLYKSRISELENAEQQSRAREAELQKKLDLLESDVEQRKRIKLEDGTAVAK